MEDEEFFYIFPKIILSSQGEIQLEEKLNDENKSEKSYVQTTIIKTEFDNYRMTLQDLNLIQADQDLKMNQITFNEDLKFTQNHKNSMENDHIVNNNII